MKKQLSFFDRLMLAVTFAEADEGDTALRLLDPKALSDPLTQAAVAPGRCPSSDLPGAR